MPCGLARNILQVREAFRLWVNCRLLMHELQRLPHTQPVHEAFPDLDGVAARGSASRFVVDTHADQCRSVGNEGLLDQPFEILFIGSPAAVAKAAGDRDGDEIG